MASVIGASHAAPVRDRGRLLFVVFVIIKASPPTPLFTREEVKKASPPTPLQGERGVRCFVVLIISLRVNSFTCELFY